MIVNGTLLDLTNRPISNGLIQIASTLTTSSVLLGSTVHIKTDDDGIYDFELLPGAYDIYAQTSRCSDVVYLGPTVITVDTADGSLNSIIGITSPILPPQVEQAVNAANEAQLHAEKAKIERVKVEGVAVEIEQDVKQVADSVAQAESYVQSTSDNTAIAVSAKDEVIVAKVQVEKIAVSVGNNVRVVEQIKHDVTELKAQTEKDVALSSSHANSAEQSKNASANSALSADAKSREAFKYVQQSKEQAEVSAGHADRAELAVKSVDTSIDEINRCVSQANFSARKAVEQATIAESHQEESKRNADLTLTYFSDVQQIQVDVDNKSGIAAESAKKAQQFSAKAELSSIAASDSERVSSQYAAESKIAADSAKVAVIGVATDLISTHNLIISLHPIAGANK